MTRYPLPKNPFLRLVLIGLLAVIAAAFLGACQTRQERESIETPPPEPPPQQSRAADEPAAEAEKPHEEESRKQEPDEGQPRKGEPAESAEAVAQGQRAQSEQGGLQAPAGNAGDNDSAPGTAPAPSGDSGEEGPSAPGGERERGLVDGFEHADGAGSGVPQNSDERFRDAMQRFDRRLARERFGTQRPEEESSGGAGGGPGGGSGRGTGGGTEEREAAASSGAGNPFEGDGQEVEQSSNSAGRGGIGGRNRHSPPPGTPDGSDDDIVARQLREAAENEPDPELRERLWEEYRAYKNDQG